MAKIEMKPCPACDKQINKYAKECPECKKKLNILNWELELDSGEKVIFSEPNIVDTIREQLISGKLKLSNRCRKFTTTLQRVTDGKDCYETKDQESWKALKDYANKSFELQVLYNPVQAYGKRFALIFYIIIAIITAIASNTNGLLAVGANPIAAIVLSILLIALLPTLIGLVVASFFVSAYYRLPAMSMAWSTFFAFLIGVIVGGAVGATTGYLIGIIIGSTKKKVLIS